MALQVQQWSFALQAGGHCWTQLSIMLDAMKTTISLQAEITLQWQDTVLIYNLIKTFLIKY